MSERMTNRLASLAEAKARLEQRIQNGHPKSVEYKKKLTEYRLSTRSWSWIKNLENLGNRALAALKHG